jgi:hypothetical protein
LAQSNHHQNSPAALGQQQIHPQLGAESTRFHQTTFVPPPKIPEANPQSIQYEEGQQENSSNCWHARCPEDRFMLL